MANPTLTPNNIQIDTDNIIKTNDLSVPIQSLKLSRHSLFVMVVCSVLSCYSVKSKQKKDIVQYDSLTKAYVYAFVEQMPNYEGGNSAFIKDFGTGFQYHFQPNEEI